MTGSTATWRLFYDLACHEQKGSVLYRFDWTETGVLTMAI
jgi:hypothetical protein